MKTTIAFIEKREHLTSLLEMLKHKQDAIEIIALTPEASYVLDKAHIPYKILEDYVDEILPLELNHYFFTHADKLTKYMDNYFSRHLPAAERADSKLFRKAFYGIYMTTSAVMIKIRLLKAFFDSLRESGIREVYYFQKEAEDDFKRELDMPLFEPYSLYSRIIPLVAQAEKIKCTAIPLDNSTSRDSNNNGLAERTAMGLSITSFYDKIRISKFNIARQFLCPWNIGHFFKRRKRTVLTLHWGYDIKEVLKKICSENRYNVLFFNKFVHNQPFYILPLFTKCMNVFMDKKSIEKIRKLISYLWKDFANNPDFRGFFRYINTDFFDILKPRLFYYATETLPLLIMAYHKWMELADKECVKLLITSGAYHALDRTIISACRSRNIPIVVYQHGVMETAEVDKRYLPDIIGLYTDLEDADCFFAYSDKIASSFEQRKETIPEVKAKPISIGSARLSEIIAKNNGKDKARPFKKHTVVYIPDFLRGDNYYSPLSFSDIRYFRLQKRIIETVKDFPDIDFVVKTISSCDGVYNPLSDYIKDIKLSNCKTVLNGDLTSMLQDASLFIFDTIPSTGFFEALTTDKKIIFYYGKSNRIQPRDLELLKRRVIFADTEKEFTDAIKNELKLIGTDTAAKLDKGYLSGYAANIFNKHGSAKKAAKAINSLIEKEALS